MTTEQKLRQIVGEIIGVDPQELNEHTTMQTVKDWDSLKQLSLMLALEQEFSISIRPEDGLEMISYPLIKLILRDNYSIPDL